MFSLLHLHHRNWVVTSLISVPTEDLTAAINSILQVNKKSPAFDPSKAATSLTAAVRGQGEKKKESKMRASDVEETI